MVTIEINGQSIEAPDGAMVLEVADKAGITIPRFCYHSKLSIAANCRMCLVEVEKAPKPLPACATPVTEGMKVHTRSPRAIAAQRGVMEFLLINHPLDCPICDQGGECDLQEMAVGFGNDYSEFGEEKRVVASKNIGPLIATDMTRCIHCTRCVRFGQEIAGVMELGATGRGEHMKIGTYVERSVNSELSGNVIDLCPVGALTSRPYRYSARPWELNSAPSVSPHDCLGANVTIQSRRGEVLRVVPRDNEALNEVWLADRDRFGYLALNHQERLSVPMIKRDGVWHEVDWDSALTFAAEGLKATANEHGADKLGALASYSASVEEFYLLQKLMRGIGSNNIDHRLRRNDFSAQGDEAAAPALGCSLAELEAMGSVLLVGSNVRKEQPLVGHRIRKAFRAGASVMAINPVDYDFNFGLVHKAVVPPAAMARELALVAHVLLDAAGGESPAGLDDFLAGAQPHDYHHAMAAALRDAPNAVVLLGSGALAHSDYSILRALAALVAELSGARVGVLPEGGNAAGAWLAGAVPHRKAGGVAAAVAGRHWRTMFEQPMKGYVLLGVEPQLDCAASGSALRAMQGAQFVVSLTAFADETMRDYADVLLPIALYPESSGTYVNLQGEWQSVAAAVAPPGEARPAWKLLRVLGNLFDLSGFEYMASTDVLAEVQAQCTGVAGGFATAWKSPIAAVSDGLQRIADFPIYSVDAMVRRAGALQQSADAAPAAARVSSATARQQGVADAPEVTVSAGESSVVLPLVIDERIPDGCVHVPAGQAGSVGLNDGVVSLQAAVAAVAGE